MGAARKKAENLNQLALSDQSWAMQTGIANKQEKNKCHLPLLPSRAHREGATGKADDAGAEQSIRAGLGEELTAYCWHLSMVPSSPHPWNGENTRTLHRVVTVPFVKMHQVLIIVSGTE